MSFAPTSVRAQSAWDIDTTHSNLGFSVHHLVISTVHGRFDRWTGTMFYDSAHPERSHIEVRIETASIDTHDEKRDTHLRSPEFFDAGKYPEITFQSTRIERGSPELLRMAGDLTISGVKLPVVLRVETLGFAKDPWGTERAVFLASATIDRRDFGLAWNQELEAGEMLIGDKVEIAILVEAIKRTESPGTRPV